MPAENEHKEQITDVPAAEELAEEPVVEAAMPVPPAALPAPPPSWSAPVFAESIEAAGPGDCIPELPDELVRRRKVAAVPRPRPQLPTVRRPVKPLVVARHTWSAEEFDGELDDRVAVRH